MPHKLPKPRIIQVIGYMWWRQARGWKLRHKEWANNWCKFCSSKPQQSNKSVAQHLLRKSTRNLNFFPQPAKMSGKARRLPSDFYVHATKMLRWPQWEIWGMLRKRAEFVDYFSPLVSISCTTNNSCQRLLH